jgi:hypothetical protein
MGANLINKRWSGNVNAHQLISEQEDSLEGEFAVAEVEQVLERRTEEIEDHGIVVAFGTEPPDERHADTASECLVDLALILELRMLGLDGFEFDSDLFAGNNIYTEINVT